MDWRNYISVMTPVASSGNIVFSLETLDATSNIALVLNVSATAGDSEITLARKIKDQLVIEVGQASATYSGMPVMCTTLPLATFYTARTDHVVSIWSQAQFSLAQVSNNTGAILKISSTPTLLTLAQAKNIGPLLGVDFMDDNGINYTDQQIMDSMELASGQIISLVNNNFVISNYLEEHIGHMEGAIQLRIGPIIDYDTPVVLPPSLIPTSLNYLITYGGSFAIDRKTKILAYRFDSNLFNVYDPFEMRNEVKLTYRAGLMNIPKIVIEKTLQISSFLDDILGVTELKGGSFDVKLGLPTDVIKLIAAELRAYRNG